MLEWNKSCVCYRRPGADMSLILMHFYVAPIVQRNAWRNRDEIPQWFYLHCIKVSGCRPKTGAFWRSQVIYDLFMILNINVSFFIRSSLISQSWISLPCRPFAVAVYFLLLCISLHFLYRHFILFLLSYQRFFIFTHVFIRKMGKCICCAFHCSDNDLYIWPNNVKLWAGGFVCNNNNRNAICRDKLLISREMMNLCFCSLYVDRKPAYLCLLDSVLSKMSSGIHVQPLRFHMSTLQKKIIHLQIILNICNMWT